MLLLQRAKLSYRVGSRLIIVAWFVSFAVGFLPDLKGRSIRVPDL